MKEKQNGKMPYAFVMYPALITLMIYVFAYHLAYPFSSTIFLYIAFANATLYLFLKRKIFVNSQVFAMLLIVLVSLCGLLYTDNFEGGVRESILNCVMLVILITVTQDNVLPHKIRKMIFVFSIVVLAGVLLQYALRDSFNVFMQNIFRSDCYESFIWSYTTDKAYAGFSAYTADAAYFCAVLFGFVVFDSFRDGKKHSAIFKILCIAIALLCIFAIILTSKRGLIIALSVSFLISYMISKKVSLKTIISTCTIIAISYVILLFLQKNNEIIGHFLERFNSSGDRDITTGRTEMWAIALNNMTNVIFGMGTGSAYTLFSNGLHNIYLQLLYDHGIIGLLIYAHFFICNLTSAIKRNDPGSIYIQMVMLLYGISGNPIYSNSFFIIYIIYSSAPKQITKKNGS